MVFQSIAICLLFIFYACYFIKMLMQKKKGIQTDHIGKGKTGYVKIIEIVMKIASIAVPITELISILLNTGNLPAGFRNCRHHHRSFWRWLLCCCSTYDA